MSQCGYMRQSQPLDNEQQDYSLARCYSDELMAHMIVSTEYSIEKIGSLNFIGTLPRRDPGDDDSRINAEKFS